MNFKLKEPTKENLKKFVKSNLDQQSIRKNVKPDSINDQIGFVKSLFYKGKK